MVVFCGGFFIWLFLFGGLRVVVNKAGATSSQYFSKRVIFQMYMLFFIPTICTLKSSMN